MRFLVYLFPLLINIVAGGTFFITAYRLSKAGVNSTLVGATLAAWAIPYAVSSLLVGKFTHEKNAAKLVICGAFAIALDSLAFLIFDGLYMQFLWLAVNGICFALYCTPFQVFSKSLETTGRKTTLLTGAVHSASLYTASWSLGIAIGPFIFGFLSYKTGFSLNALFGILIGISLWGIDRAARKKDAVTPVSATEDQPQENPQEEKMVFPDMVMVGWLLGLAVSISVTIARTMIPNRAVALDFSRTDAAMILCTLSVVQSLFALAMYRSRKWMYKVLPVAFLGVCGILAVMLFGLCTDRILFYAGAVIYGIFSGGSYYALVFHSLAHPTKSAKYVAVNEAVVGLSNIMAPTLAGYLVLLTGNTGTGFLMAGASILILHLIIFFLLFRIRRSVA
jgi:MFS family permease